MLANEVSFFTSNRVISIYISMRKISEKSFVLHVLASLTEKFSFSLGRMISDSPCRIYVYCKQSPAEKVSVILQNKIEDNESVQNLHFYLTCW